MLTYSMSVVYVINMSPFTVETHLEWNAVAAFDCLIIPYNIYQYVIISWINP